jgi:hypothetical protein
MAHPTITPASPFAEIQKYPPPKFPPAKKGKENNMLKERFV